MVLELTAPNGCSVTLGGEGGQTQLKNWQYVRQTERVTVRTHTNCLFEEETTSLQTLWVVCTHEQTLCLRALICH